MADPNRTINLFNFADNRAKIYGSEECPSNKEDGELEEENVYCICRTSDTNRFMIGCDACNEWYHGDCINVSQKFAQTIKTFYCIMCREKNHSLEIIFKEKKIPKKKEKPEKPVEVNVELPDEDAEYIPEKKKTKYFESDDALEDEDFEATVKIKSRRGRKPGKLYGTKRGQKKHAPKNSSPAAVTGGGKGRRRVKPEVAKPKRTHKKGAKEITDFDDGPKQCYGPGCIKASRKGSKYCSDECGMKLATNRIYEILPHRIRQWQSTTSVSDEFSHRELDKIRQEQQDAKKTLERLDKRQKDLENLLAEIKNTPPISDDEFNENETESESELSTYCVTCGHEVQYRFAMKHMERCFNKYESQTSFGSVFKTKIEGVFCDFFNQHQHTYCKRLRILCPEHSKEAKIADDEVCGFPLVDPKDCFKTTGSLCRVAKKKCNKHFCWEKFRRAEIDMERVQQWLKLDELFEKEQKIRFTMSNRGGVLALMLHQTIIHDSGE